MPKSSHPLLRSLGIAIRSRRRERGLSQESLADLAKIDRSYMSSVERGLRNVSILSIARIAGALEVPMWDLLRPRRIGVAAQPGWREAAGDLAGAPSPTDADVPADRYLPGDVAPHGPGGSSWEPRYLSLG